MPITNQRITKLNVTCPSIRDAHDLESLMDSAEVCREDFDRVSFILMLDFDQSPREVIHALINAGYGVVDWSSEKISFWTASDILENLG